jgi:type IV pilus assembly protein PilB
MAWRLGEILIQKRLISWDDLGECLEEQKKTREFIGEILVRRGRVAKSLLYLALAEQFDIRYVDLSRIRINPKAIEVVPQSLAEKYLFMPIDIHDGVLTLGIDDPLKKWPEAEICKLARVSSTLKVLCMPEAIQLCLKEHYN